MDVWDEMIARVEATHGIVTHSDLLAAGISPRQILRQREAGRLVDLHHGVYRVAGAPPTYEARVAAALRIVDEDGQSWASHHTGSRMWGIGIHGRDQRIEILRPKLLSAARGGVLVHRSTLIPPHHVTVLRGLPVTTPSRTLFDLARSTGPVVLGRGITKAIQVRDIPCSLPSLYRVLYDLGGRGRPGTRRFREVLDTFDPEEPPTESVLDEIGRSLLRRVPGIRWQVEMSDERGYIRRVDGLVEDIPLVIELDSVFHDDPVQRALDDEGDRRLLALGYPTRRLRWPDLTRRGDLTLDEILRLVADRAA
jgi:very-short-patch-repair endonuclease